MKARDLVSSTETLVQEMEFLNLKTPELEEKTAAFEVDLVKLEEELSEQQKKIDSRNAEIGPTLQKVELLKRNCKNCKNLWQKKNKSIGFH